MNWINVKDEMPEEDKKVIVYSLSAKCCVPNNTVTVASYDYGYEKWNYGEYECKLNVTHWMPLPEPPKEQNV